jgi:hypothetical protein
LRGARCGRDEHEDVCADGCGDDHRAGGRLGNS